MHPKTAVDYRAVDDPATAHYRMDDDQSFTVPTPITRTEPEYPLAFRANPPDLIVVHALVVVDSAGHVQDVRIAPDQAHPAAFDEAVSEAVRQWQFTPFTVKTWEEVKDDDGNVVDSRIAHEESRPFSEQYEFVFRSVNGKPEVQNAPSQR